MGMFFSKKNMKIFMCLKSLTSWLKKNLIISLVSKNWQMRVQISWIW